MIKSGIAFLFVAPLFLFGNAIFSCTSRNNSFSNSFLSHHFSKNITQILLMASSLKQKPILSSEVTFLRYFKDFNIPKPINTNTTNLDCSRKIIIMIHGWTNNGTMLWIIQYAETFLMLDPSNYIIAVDWQKIANEPYLEAAAASKPIAEIAAGKYLNLTGNNPKCFANTQIIGHSVGAHIAGGFGQFVYHKTGVKIDRITGLDPAGPLFTIPFCVSEDWRYTKNDAKFTDCYHTNILMEGQGPIGGQVDFYINCGGPIQPGCYEKNLQKAVSCSHQKVHDYFYDTIRNSTIYVAHRCSGQSNENHQIYAGQFVDKNATGIYCVGTTNKTSTNGSNVGAVKMVVPEAPFNLLQSGVIKCAFHNLFRAFDNAFSSTTITQQARAFKSYLGSYVEKTKNNK